MKLSPGDQRLQKRTVGGFIRLYIQRRRDSSKLDNTILTPLKRSMSDSRLLRKHNQFQKQAEVDIEYEEKTNVLSKRLSIEDSDGRDSSTSSDSQNSFKKQASINEIQELYSALQDLVDTNVTKTPLPERRAKLSITTPVGSPKLSRGLGERTLTVPEKALRKISSRISHSSSFEKERTDQLSRHKRGSSAGTIDAVTNFMRMSPFQGRKFSHDVVSTTKETKKNSTTKNPRLEQKKWRGAKLFNLLRPNKNSAELSDDNDDKLSTDDDEFTPNNNSKQLSDAGAVKVRRINNRNYNQEENEDRNSLNEETKKEIEQLVASFNLETNNDNSFKTPTETIAKDPVDQLNQLESWFEQAAAESLNNRPASRTLPEDSSSDVSPDVRNHRPRKKQSTSNRRGTHLRRISSNKDERKARREKKANKSFDLSGMTHAQSTPDLLFNDDCNVLTDKGVTYKVLGQLNHVNNSKTTSTNNKTKKLSLEGTSANRFPDHPMFYLPKNDTNEDSELHGKNNRQGLTSSMFYTEKENNAKNKKSESLPKSKREKRPKSMFEYLDDDDDFHISDDDNSNTESIKNNINKDTNANFCRANIMRSPHSISLCDLSKTTMVQEKSLWEKFKKTAGSKKLKAVIA